jgi:hypothetical protein|tara:strand:+ start:738 stop:1049 length:312 start_codon:yes stop_codon:yes gene_type:complete
MIEITVKHIPWPFPKTVHAVAIWPFIFYEEHVRFDKAIQAHERYHLADQKRWLVIPWFITYVALLPFYGGYRQHPLERRAYLVQDYVHVKNRATSHEGKNKEE